MSEQASAQATSKPAKAGRGKTVAIASVAVVLLLGGGGLAAFWFLKPPSAATPEAEHKPAHPAGGGVVSFEPFVVNLADAGGARFLRINVRIVVEEEEQAKHIQESEVTLTRMRSALLELLTLQTAERLVTPEGKVDLKKTIAERAAGILEPAKVSDVLFSDFVVQF